VLHDTLVKRVKEAMVEAKNLRDKILSVGKELQVKCNLEDSDAFGEKYRVSVSHN
jgi:hypothetical protein